MDKIFLIDGHAQIFRMYYAFMRRPMVNSKGYDTSILFGFTKMLLELINKESPTHIAVAFDPPVKTFRHNIYPEYKANRSAAPELVKAALEPLKEILSAFNIPVVMINGFEADDVIGSMATQWSNNNCNIYMVTPDKDYGQLVSSNIFQYKPAKGGNDIEILGPEQICKNYGICEPNQVRDILTIWGDASDNVPGVRGIGEVGAKKLIGKYGNIENILSNLSELPAKQQDGFREFESQLQMSRFLVTIKTDIELPLTPESIKVQQPDMIKLSEVFNKYEFNSLKKFLPNNITLENHSNNDNETTSTPENSFAQNLVQSEIINVLNIAKTTGEISIKLDRNTLFVAAQDKAKDKIYYTSTNNYNQLSDVIQNVSIAKTGFNIKECIKFFKQNGIEPKGNYYDIGLMHYLINPERTHKENFLIKSYLNIDNIGGLDNQNNNKDNDIDLFSASEENIDKNIDKECALEIPLRRCVESELESSGQVHLYKEIEMPLIEILADMELEGFKIDTNHLKNYSKELTSQMNSIESRARELADEPDLNLSSPKQVGIVLFEKLKLDSKIKKSKKGNYSTSEEILNELRNEHPIIPEILEYRELKKLLSTYIDNLPELISPKTGKIHTNFNQALTATGRLSSSNPNLQNIPIRTERGKEIRKAFIPSSPNNFIVSADYSQIELRLMAHLSGDSNFIEAFNNGKDVHTATAAKIFKVSESEVTREQRSRAKTANFGIIYGISAFGLSQRLGISRTESKQLIEQYFNSYPGVKEYMNNMILQGREQGYVETIFKRKRYLPDINSRNAAVRAYNERNAINAPLQGSAADIIKVAMINIYRELKRENLKSKLILQVHDELIFDVPSPELNIVQDIIKREMESVIKLKVPLIAECGYGKNWLEAH